MEQKKTGEEPQFTTRIKQLLADFATKAKQEMEKENNARYTETSIPREKRKGKKDKSSSDEVNDDSNGSDNDDDDDDDDEEEEKPARKFKKKERKSRASKKARPI